MTIREAQEKDYGKLVNLFKDFFKTHNIFQKSKEEVIDYLKEQSKENKLIILEDGSIKGALFLVNFGQNPDGSHKLWKFRHFAFDSEDTASKLLKEAEDKIKKSSKTAKIELTIAENERGIDFYKSKGYMQEAKLTNHYRWGEVCFILSKSFQK